MVSKAWWTDPNATHAFRLSWLSVVVTAAAAIGGISSYGRTGSSLILCYGLENCVDFFSSVVVLWRFYCPHGADPSRIALLQKREKRASVAISIILGILGLTIIIAAIEDFTQGEEDEGNLRLLAILSFFSILIFGAFAAIKFHYAKMLHSASLHKDGICSLIGTILAGSLFVNSLIIMQESAAWWLDPAVAICCGIASLYIGFKAVFVAWFVQGIPIWRPSWWILSQGDGTDEFSGRPLGEEDMMTGEGGAAHRSGDEFADQEMPKVEPKEDVGMERAPEGKTEATASKAEEEEDDKIV